MTTAMQGFKNVGEMLRSWQPMEPVYCIYPHVYRETTGVFLRGFPGRVLYAVKANDDPAIIGILNRAGIGHFDCASLPEIRLVRKLCPEAECYFMVPVTVRGAFSEAFHQHGVRHFMVDHPAGLDILEKEVSMPDCVVFARMAVSHDSAKMDLSSKFGAPPAEMPALLNRIRTLGAEPALAFNVGSMVTSPEAYRHAIRVARDVLEPLDFRVRLIDIGGGFPRSYPGFPVPPLDEFFRAVSEASGRLPMQKGGELMAEPGRAHLPDDIRSGDYLEFGNIGAYSLSGRTRFNGHYSERIVEITSPDATPP